MPAQVTAEPQGIIGGWITVDPPNGTVAAGKVTSVQLQYDISQQGFQGQYTADVLITTNARPVAKVRPGFRRTQQLVHSGCHSMLLDAGHLSFAGILSVGMVELLHLLSRSCDQPMLRHSMLIVCVTHCAT